MEIRTTARADNTAPTHPARQRCIFTIVLQTINTFFTFEGFEGRVYGDENELDIHQSLEIEFNLI